MIAGRFAAASDSLTRARYIALTASGCFVAKSRETMWIETLWLS